MICRRKILIISTAVGIYTVNSHYVSSCGNTPPLISTKTSAGDLQLKETLAKLRENEAEIRLRWIRDEDNWRKLPSRAWPEVQPDVDDIPLLRSRSKENCTLETSALCINSRFVLATALVFNRIEGNEGINIYESLAELRNSDSMTALGICFLEGLPRDEVIDMAGGLYSRIMLRLFTNLGYFITLDP